MTFVDTVRQRVRVTPQTARDVGIGVVVCGMLIYGGMRGWRSARASRVEVATLRATLDATDGLARRFVPVQPAEREEWEKSLAAVRELGFETNDRLALLEVVSQRAADVGIPNAHVTFIGPTGAEPRGAAEWAVQPAEYGLFVNVRGDYWSTVSMLGALPPMVEVQQLSLMRSEGEAMGDLTLAVYQAAEPDAAQADAPGALTAAQWTELRRYLQPVEAAVVQYAGTMTEPGAERDPFSTPYAPREPDMPMDYYDDDAVVAEPPVQWTVSAIFITDSVRRANINQRWVERGDTLAGGGRVAAIEADHVIVEDRRGRMRHLQVNREGEG